MIQSSEISALVERLRVGNQSAAGPIEELFASANDADVAVRAILDAPTVAYALHELGGRLWDQSGCELFAIEILKESVRLGSDEALISLAEALFWMGADEDTVNVLDEARRRKIGDPSRVSGMLGEARLSLGDESRGVEALLEEGAASYPEFALSYAKLLSKHGKAHAARTVLESLVDTKEFGAALALGNLLDDEFGETDLAISAYLRGIDTGDSHSAYNLAVLFYRIGDIVESERFFRTAREMGDLTDFPDFDA